MRAGEIVRVEPAYGRATATYSVERTSANGAVSASIMLVSKGLCRMTICDAATDAPIIVVKLALGGDSAVTSVMPRAATSCEKSRLEKMSC